MVDISGKDKGLRNHAAQKHQVTAAIVMTLMGLILLFLSNHGKDSSYDSSDGDAYGGGGYNSVGGGGGEQMMSVTLDVDDPKVRDLINQYLRDANPLGVPLGAAQALPSIRVEDEKANRRIYGGKGDKAHLGGFTIYDKDGVSPATWKWMIQELNVKSLIE